MANQKLSQLTATTALATTDLMYTARTAGSRKLALSTFADLLGIGRSVRLSGAAGNGIADDTSAIQAAYDAARLAGVNLVIPSGTYRITAQITLLDTDSAGADEWIPSIIGEGRVIINQETAAAWTFWLRAKCGASVYIDLNKWEMSNITINAKFGISFNNILVAGADYGSDSTGLCSLLGPTFRNIVINGTYGSGVDPNYDSAVIPTHDQLAAFGIGLRMCKVYDAKIQGGWWLALGIALALYGADLTNVHALRFQSNARHFHHRGIGGNYGSQTKLDHCDILGNYRQYGVYNESNYFFMSVSCFYENATDQSFLYEDSSFSSTYLNNRFNSLNPGSVRPWCTLKPVEVVKFHSNRWFSNGTFPDCEVLTTSWTVSRQIIAEFLGNDVTMPISNVPGVRVGQFNNLLFTGANFENVNGSISNSYPWELDGERWVIKGVAGLTNLVAIMSAERVPDRFLVRITAKLRDTATPPAGGIGLTWVPEGGTYPADAIDIFSGGFQFTSDTEYETIDAVCSATADPEMQESGQFVIALTNDTLMIASLEIIPFVDAPGVRSTPDAVYPQHSTLVQAQTKITNDTTDNTPPTAADIMAIVTAAGCPEISFRADNSVLMTVTFGILIPIHADNTHRSGYFGANGGGLSYDSARQNDVELGCVGTTHLGTWSANPWSNLGATFVDAMRVMPSGRVIFGVVGDADPGSGKVVVYGDTELYDGHITTRTIGKGLRIKGGANSKIGSGVTLVGGTKTVANTSVTANSQIHPTRTAIGGTPGTITWTVNPGVGFTIDSDNPADTSTFSYFIVEEV